MISIEMDKKALAQALKAMKIAPKKVAQAIAAAENRTITQTQKEISKKVSGTYFIKSRTVKQTLISKRASASKLEAYVKSEGHPIYLGRFKVGPYNRKRRMWARVRKGAKRTAIPGLFRSVAGKGPAHRMSKNRHDIAIPFGPSVPQMIGNKEILEEIAKHSEETLNKRVMHELEWRFKSL